MKDIAGRELKLGDMVVYWRNSYSINSIFSNGYAIVTGEGKLWSQYGIYIVDSYGCYLATMTEDEVEKKKNITKSYTEYIERKLRRNRESYFFTKAGMYGLIRHITKRGNTDDLTYKIITHIDKDKYDIIVYLGKVQAYWNEMSDFDEEEMEEVDIIYKRPSYAYLYYYGTEEELRVKLKFIEEGVFDIKDMLSKCKKPYIDDMSGKLSRNYGFSELLLYDKRVTEIDKFLGECTLKNWDIGDTLFTNSDKDITITRLE